MRLFRLVYIGLLTVLWCPNGFSQPLAFAERPEDIGIDSQRLEHIHRRLKADVDARLIPGAVLLIARRGKVADLHAVGLQDPRSQQRMSTTSVFRIASMSKPITSVGAMILAEQGKLDIGAPVEQYLPEFKGVRVGMDKAVAKRLMTIQDLLRHTSGLIYGFGDSPVDKLYQQSDLFSKGSLAEMVKAVASLPLAHDPGAEWEYSISTDVLGRILEVVSGMELDRFLAEYIATPLKMVDTGFHLNPTQVTRFARPDAGASRTALDRTNPDDFDPTSKPKVLSGGAGMLSSAGDYARFCQMLLNRGDLEGVRILSRKTVELMTSDQLPPSTERPSRTVLAMSAFGPSTEMGISFGFGFAVRTDPGRNPVPGSVGTFSWMGGRGTHFWVDPNENLVAVLMAYISRERREAYWRQIRTLVYQTLTD